MPEKTSQIPVLITAALFLSVGIFVIAYILLYNKRQLKNQMEKDAMQKDFALELANSKIEVQEATFATIADDLHNNICQILSSAKILLAISITRQKNMPEEIVTAESSVGLAIQELRLMARSLSKSWIEQFSLIDNLNVEAKRISGMKTVDIHLSLPEFVDLETEKQIMLFRVVQEATQNAIKHAHAQQINIEVVMENTFLQASITDDGIGLKPGNKDGLGFISMKQRIASLQGSIQWSSSNNKGCLVTIKIPLTQNL